MAHALKNLDVDDLHYLIPVVGKATRWFASMNTQYNPIFGIINLMRDTQDAALNLSTTELAGKQGEILKDQLSILKEVLQNKGRIPKTGSGPHCSPNSRRLEERRDTGICSSTQNRAARPCRTR